MQQFDPRYREVKIGDYRFNTDIVDFPAEAITNQCNVCSRKPPLRFEFKTSIVSENRQYNFENLLKIFNLSELCVAAVDARYYFTYSANRSFDC
jgi:hypothetical protein